MNSIVQNILIFVGLLAVAGVGYYTFYVRGTSDLQTETESAATAQAEVATQNFLTRLQQLRSVDLSTDLFASDRFINLRDFSTPVRPQPTGRANPFAPRGEN